MQRVAYAVLMMAVMTACGGGGTDGPVAPPAPVLSTVTVTIAPSTIQMGQSASATAELRTSAGAVLTGRAVSWTSSTPSVASVDANGVITSVAVGTATISATSEGKTGSATITVRYNIATVVFNGATRVKVGDSYPYTITARLADGTVVNRPVTWSVVEAGRAQVNAGGVMTPLQAGTFTMQVLIDGTAWTASYTAYDWETLSSGGASFAVLSADVPVTNRFGTSDRPELIASCGSSGYFFVWVRFPHIVTRNGLVAYSFDGAPGIAATWDELSPDYRSLWFRGTNAAAKSFTAQIAASRQFGFAFGEFNGSAQATLFRVTGATGFVAPLYTLCPSNAIVAEAPGADRDAMVPTAEAARVMAAYETSRGIARVDRVSETSAARVSAGPAAGESSALLRAWPVWRASNAETRQAKRVR